MQLHEVDVIKELSSVKEVNEALKDGWRIVAVVAAAEGNSGDLLVPCYVLGRKIKKEQQMPTAADLMRANEGL